MGQQQDVAAVETNDIRTRIRDYYLADESQTIGELLTFANFSQQERAEISTKAADLVRTVRANSTPTLMEKFLGEYGLSTNEGLALMCMAEALLRVPDTITLDDLIEDKVVSGDWKGRLGQAKSALVNASTWGLLITSKIFDETQTTGLISTVGSLIRKIGKPLVRNAVNQAMKELGRQFVLGRTIEEATKRATKLEARGYSYSYDMLGEAARTEADAQRYHKAYGDAIDQLAKACKSTDIRVNPGVSIKLSALHPRYEFGQQARVMKEMVPRVLELALKAKAANMGFNIDAEEADRLDISLDVIEAVLSNPQLEGWDGFGIVVQAFGLRAAHVLDWLYATATRLNRRIMVRLVKGAYWDAEVKRAQVMGLDGFPVYTRKVNSDVSYMCCARKLLGMTDRIYPQFATHNAHSMASILNMATDKGAFEFQRLHGMGESLHEIAVSKEKVRCRIYAPVGAHKDLLAYLVRRLLENGANSSFVNQIVDHSISPEEIARDPIATIEAMGANISNPNITRAEHLYGEGRRNSIGWDWTHATTFANFDAARQVFKKHQWTAVPMIAGNVEGAEVDNVINPANPNDIVGQVTNASAQDIETAIAAAQQGFAEWSAVSQQERSVILRKVADLFEEYSFELFALATREAGKNQMDAVAEIREAVDFALYYANEAEREQTAGTARGVISCISPWNFPLAIFAGQVLAALASGNAVIAKPAGQTALIAARAVELMHLAGIPKAAMQLLPGGGSTVGAAITSDSRIAGVCFTGSTATAQRINGVMAKGIAPDAPLVAETGGLNAMIVDSSALPEQVVRDVVASAFQSAGQRCSALRMLYLQKDIADHVIEMLMGAMDELVVSDPWLLSTDVGPVIDDASKAKIEGHVEKFAAKGRLLKRIDVPAEGRFVSPAIIKLTGIEELEEEIFGPILHIATFEAADLEKVVDTINSKGFGLTFGLHTRIDSRVERIVNSIKVGNIYVNRNQIGAIVGSQPFGGEGLSGTGPKAGGPMYVRRFMHTDTSTRLTPAAAGDIEAGTLQHAINQVPATHWASDSERSAKLQTLFSGQVKDLCEHVEHMPGPTGELNRLSCFPRGLVLCLGPDVASATQQAHTALAQGNSVVVVVPGATQAFAKTVAAGLPVVAVDGLVKADALAQVKGINAIVSVADETTLRSYREALATRDGVLLPLITEQNSPERFVLERHLCIDTTAAGGNASLIAASE